MVSFSLGEDSSAGMSEGEARVGEDRVGEDCAAGDSAGMMIVMDPEKELFARCAVFQDSLLTFS